ncbi:hypothetical protein [Aureimonas ureilytica]|uniref:hypothetical protein n=1 Tax=Aureimonas ureilytica TaxID=401562 RepID=UPI0012DF708C|nr:hypothetical protein [Aureimonas ureilytica]
MAQADSLSEARQGAKRGAAIFQKTYGESGMLGLNAASKDCWKAYRGKLSARKFAECASLDLNSFHLDNAASKQMGWEPDAYMTGKKTIERYERAEKALKLSAKEQEAIGEIVVGSATIGR